MTAGLTLILLAKAAGADQAQPTVTAAVMLIRLAVDAAAADTQTAIAAAMPIPQVGVGGINPPIPQNQAGKVFIDLARFAFGQTF